MGAGPGRGTHLSLDIARAILQQKGSCSRVSPPALSSSPALPSSHSSSRVPGDPNLVGRGCNVESLFPDCQPLSFPSVSSASSLPHTPLHSFIHLPTAPLSLVSSKPPHLNGHRAELQVLCAYEPSTPSAGKSQDAHSHWQAPIGMLTFCKNSQRNKTLTVEFQASHEKRNLGSVAAGPNPQCHCPIGPEL